jgi:6-pyruvoyltetrahydropterin/6-carboxytetrahydropterin synthase
MYRVSKKMEISAMHHLELSYDSPCESFHGHNWYITVEVEGPELNEDGMLIDFTIIKQLIHGKMDHKNLNDVFTFNPTAENISKWVSEQIDNYLSQHSTLYVHCSKVRVEETQGNYSEWERSKD